MVLAGLLVSAPEVFADMLAARSEACANFREAIHRHDTYRRAYYAQGGPQTPDAGRKHAYSFRDAFNAGLAAIDATGELKAAEAARYLASHNKVPGVPDDALARAAGLRVVYIRACGSNLRARP